MAVISGCVRVVTWLIPLVGFATFTLADDKQFFNAKILPVLKKHCYECHSSQAKKVESGLKLDTREGLLRGGEMGPIISPGNPNESPLLASLRYQKLEMPPAARLPSEVADDFEEWIRRGAPDPREE
jgi:hypothetical protein